MPARRCQIISFEFIANSLEKQDIEPNLNTEKLPNDPFMN